MNSPRFTSFVNVSRHLPGMARTMGGTLALRVPLGRTTGGREIAYEDYSFSELNREVDARCHNLVEAGIQRGTRVLVMVRPGLELTALFFSLFKIGAVPVLIDPGMGMRGFIHCVASARPEAMVSIPLGIWLSRVARRSFRSVRVRYRVGGGRNPVASNGREFPVAETRAQELAAILFTSGSTGPAKGVRYEHGMFAAQVSLIRERFQIEPGEIDLPMLPVFSLFNPALGMTTVIPEINPSRPATVEPQRIVQAIRQCGVTNSFGAPVLWRKIGSYCLRQRIRLPTVRRILMAGAPVSPAILKDFGAILPNGVVHTPYGATECLPVSSLTGTEIVEKTSARTDFGAGTCVGRVLPGIAVKVIEVTETAISQELDMRILPVGEVGEIVVRGPVVTREYDGLPEENRMSKILGSDGSVWHRIGDLGYLDEEERLWFCGRKADRVLTSEGPLYTDCCEAIFNRHREVARSALIGFGAPGSQVPAIVIEPERKSLFRDGASRRRVVRELRELANGCSSTRQIELFYFARSFPVDVRHNAKIHRQTLARRFERKWRKVADGKRNDTTC